MKSVRLGFILFSLGQGQDQHDAVWAEAYQQHHIAKDQRKQPELKSALQLKPLSFGALRASMIEQNKRGFSPSVIAEMTGDQNITRCKA